MSSTYLLGLTEPPRKQGWIDYVDAQYTSESPLTLSGGTRTQVLIDGLAARSDDTYRESINYEPWTGSRFKGEIPGETYILRFGLTIRTTEDMFNDITGLITSLTTNTLKAALQRENILKIEFDFGAFQSDDELIAPRSMNSAQNVTRLYRFHSGPDVINPGAEIYLTSTYDTEAFGFDLSVDRTFVPI